MLTLLRSCLNALATLLEIKSTSEISESIKLIEESLTYLATLINFMPTESILCVRQLFKYMFRMNFISHPVQYGYLLRNEFLINDDESENDVFVRVNELNHFTSCDNGSNHSSTTTSSTGHRLGDSTSITSSPLKLIGIATALSPISTEAKRLESGNNIKLFEAIVIQCLKVSTIYNNGDLYAQAP